MKYEKNNKNFIKKRNTAGKYPVKKVIKPAEPGIKDIRDSLPDPAEIKELLGVISSFRIEKLTPIGAFLSPHDPSTQETGAENFRILLPKNEFEGRELTKNSIIEAFLYLDSEDRPIATLKTPALTIGGLAVLKCTQVTQLGAFLDWGLLKDLFLPFKEQNVKVKPGQEILVTLYIDKSSRLCASMKVYKVLKTNSPYKANDHVTGIVYELTDRHGAYVAVDDLYSAMIPARELVNKIKIGDRPELRVSKVLPDGKLELSMREPGYLQINDDCDRILKELEASSRGFLPYHDKTESLILKNKFNMSKNAFKRAIGHLYKQGLIEIHEDGISLIGE